MSIDPLDPPRIAEQASERTRSLLRATREDGPSSGAIERMSKRLAAAGALATVPSESQAPARFAAYSRTVVALAVAGGLAAWWQMTPGASTTSMTTAPVASLSGERGAPETTPRAEEPLPLRPANDPEPPTSSVDQLPSAIAPAVTIAASAGKDVRAPRATPSTESAGAPVPSELELLQRAQAALARDPVQALSITDEQARAYPSGELVQEREVIAVEALSRLGRKDEASSRARALVERFPRTPYSHRLEIAVGHPL